jgi:uncharacterized protein (DUF1330 family)
MSAYLLYICRDVHDRAELETYWKKIGPTFAGHSARMLAAYTEFDHLEGDGPVEGVVLAEFPSKAAAKAWYDSPEYREVRKHRVRGAKYLGILVEGGWKTVDERMPHTKGRSVARG